MVLLSVRDQTMSGSHKTRFDLMMGLSQRVFDHKTGHDLKGISPLRLPRFQKLSYRQTETTLT